MRCFSIRYNVRREASRSRTEIEFRDSSLVLLSGGINSSVMLSYLISKNLRNIEAIFFQYHSCSNAEEKSAREIAHYYHVKLTVVNLHPIFDILKTKDTYMEFRQKNDYYVPYRNGVFVSVAASFAYSKRLRNVIWPVSEVSSAYYSDCCMQFADHQKLCLIFGTYAKLELSTPLLFITKSEIFELGTRLKVPYNLTWSCITSGREPCGRCFGCQERKKLGLKYNYEV